MTFTRRIAIGAVAAGLTPLLFALLIHINFRVNLQDSRQVGQARDSFALAMSLHRSIIEMERAIRGFRLQGIESFLDPYRSAVLEYDHLRARLDVLLQGRPEQRLLREIDGIFVRWRTEYAEPKIELLRRIPPLNTPQGRFLPPIPPALSTQASKKAMDDFRERFDTLENRLREWISQGLEKRDRANRRLSLILWAAAIGSSLLLLGGAASLSRLYRRRARILFSGLEAAERGEYRAVALSGNDEPAKIASAFNKTLAEIERRDVELRRGLEEHKRLLSDKSSALEALQTGEKKLQAILDNTTSIVCAKDLTGRYLFINRRFAEVFHVDPREALGKTDFELFPAELAQVFQANDRRALETNAPVEVEETAPQDDGVHTFICVKFPLRDPAGFRYATCGISTDITERKRAEEEINRFFNLALEGLCIAGFDGYFKRLNPVWERMLGLSIAELQSKPFIEFVHPDDRAATTAEAQKLFSQEHETVSFTNRYRCADGSYKWLVWNSKSDPVNRLIYAAARDVTEARRTQEEVRQLNEQLARRVAELDSLSRELEAFSYSVSHDLRAPLRHIAGFSQLLEQSSGASLDEKGTRYLRTIADSAGRMGRLIDDLLLFSRMGRAQLSEGSVDLNALTQLVRRDLEPEVKGREVVWKIGELPQVRGDTSMLRQVLANLMSNALKYTGTRERAEIEIGASRNGGSETVVFVRDNGVGFDMQYAHKLFGVFQRLHRIEEFEGTGVGLANVRRIIERHGGRTWAEGELDHGATFYFSLPNTGGNS